MSAAVIAAVSKRGNIVMHGSEMANSPKRIINKTNPSRTRTYMTGAFPHPLLHTTRNLARTRMMMVS
jgi:hypothetical protein